MRFVSVVGIGLACALAVALETSRSGEADAAPGNRVEVRQFEMACFPGKPGAKVRLTLATGMAVEYRVDDPVEIETIRGLGAMFTAGGTRMFAEVDGSSVLSVQIAGPFLYRPGQ
jgi:hypothetical protein